MLDISCLFFLLIKWIFYKIEKKKRINLHHKKNSLLNFSNNINNFQIYSKKEINDKIKQLEEKKIFHIFNFFF